MRKIPKDVKDLLTEDPVSTDRRNSKIVPAFIGGMVRAVVGSLLLLFVFGMSGGNGQAGLAAVILGVPLGGWMGAEIGARKA
jgi:hypothetical protein